MNPSLQIPDEGMSVEELSNFVGIQMKRLNMVLKNIDGLNIVDIKFELENNAFIQLNRKGLIFNDGTKNTLIVDIEGNVTLEGTIEALAGHIGGFTIEADKLSSDSGNGIIQGGIIRTADEDTYPRVELDSTGNIFQALKSLTEYIAIDPDLTGSPTLKFESANVTALLSAAEGLSGFWVNAFEGDLILQSQSGTIFMFPSDFVKFEDWTKIKGATQTLQQVIDALESQISSLDTDKQDLSDKGSANGYASLDSTGHVPASQIPASVTPISSVFGRTGAVTAATNDYTWAQINKSTSSIADITTRSAGDLNSGTLPVARMPTGIDAANLADGSVSNAELQYINSLTSNAQTQLNTKATVVSGGAKIQSGTSTITTLAASNNYSKTVTFPTAFASPPVCTVTMAGDGIPNILPAPVLGTVTATTMDLFMFQADATARTMPFHWIAVGP